MINKIYLLFISLFNMLRFFILNRVSNRRINNLDYKVIVSLTCFPARIDQVYYTIESLFFQRSKVNYDIRLYLSNDEFKNNEIPNSLKRLKKRGLKIFFVDDNLKSYKKLVYAYGLENIPVITVDDDIFYPSYWINTIYDGHQNKPCDIIYLRGREIIFNGDDLKLYHEYPQAKGFEESYLTIPTGVSGILYPPNSLFDDWDNKDKFMTLAPSADDLWFKIMSLKKGTKCFLANNISIHFPPVLGTQSVSLRKLNVKNKLSPNDVQLRNLLKYYDLDFNNYREKQ
ncbi:hypothetical protein [Photobacterium sp. GB-36]|uniref:hypothetical protein n=1 Tax=Photobacterium sp. GB-36 TaxID=2022108 RepID=UPI000D16383D|nr:hypothetical protein [Photobacterium sp. GB-36]PSV46992.1 hypothetical protein C9J46_01775 [Photobacterium sp. GB-36]